jgi:hypothetical protein
MEKQDLILVEGTDIYWIQDSDGYIYEKGSKEYLENKYFSKNENETKKDGE